MTSTLEPHRAETPLQSLVEPLGMLVNGEWRRAATGVTYPLINPATGEPLSEVPDATPTDVDEAVAAARATFDAGTWRNLPAASRQDVLHRCAEALRQHREPLADLMAREGGKPVREGLGEVEQLASYFQYAAAAARHLHGDAFTGETDGAIGYTVRVPVGVVAAVTPYNFPLWTFGAKVAMALAAGCSVVLKPAPATPMSALLAASVVTQAGVPAGVLNVVTTSSTRSSAHLVEHPDVDAVTFTGSTQVGALVMRSAADTFKKVTLELGGKSPNIVFADADLDAFEESFFSSIFLNAGQVCVAGSLLLVQRESLEGVIERVLRVAAGVATGDPMHPDTGYGPLISEQHLERVDGFVHRALADGARLLAGGRRISRTGYYYEPTVLLASDPTSEACREEIFGPVVTILPFADEEEALALANGNDFGLKAACWTRDVGRLLRMVRELRAGSVMGNAYRPPVPQAAMPFGGFGRSGVGRELGLEGIINGFTETKSVMVSLS